MRASWPAGGCHPSGVMSSHPPARDTLGVLLTVAAPVITALGVLYVLVFIFLGVRCIRQGHWVMFVIGIPIPLFWLIGALLPPTQA